MKNFQSLKLRKLVIQVACHKCTSIKKISWTYWIVGPIIDCPTNKDPSVLVQLWVALIFKPMLAAKLNCSFPGQKVIMAWILFLYTKQTVTFEPNVALFLA